MEHENRKIRRNVRAWSWWLCVGFDVGMTIKWEEKLRFDLDNELGRDLSARMKKEKKRLVLDFGMISLNQIWEYEIENKEGIPMTWFWVYDKLGQEIRN